MTDTGRLDAVLALPLGKNDANARTVREFLGLLLLRVWEEQEGFSGKRPWGNSGWEYDLYKPLIEHGFVRGEVTRYPDVGPDYSEIDAVDDDAANALIADAIRRLTGTL